MEYDIGSPHQRRDLLEVPDIGALKIHLPAHLFQVAFVPAEKIVDYHHLRRPFA